MSSLLDLVKDGVSPGEGEATDLPLLLAREFIQSRTTSETERMLIAELVDFSRKFLQEHPPISQFFPGKGIGLHLQGGIDVVFQLEEEDKKPLDLGVRITAPPKETKRAAMSGEAHSASITKEKD